MSYCLVFLKRSVVYIFCHVYLRKAVMAILMHEERKILSTFCNGTTPLRLLVKHMPGSYVISVVNC